MELLSIIFRTLFFYFFIVISYRIMGKREIGQLGVIDLIVSILIAELVAISIENINDTIIFTIIPILLLVVLEILLAKISLKSKKVNSLFSGKPSVMILNGKVNYKEMIKQRYNLDDLLLQLRQNKVKSIEEVEYAVLETNGKLSVFKYNLFKIPTNYPVPVIIDGNIQYQTLKNIDKTASWLSKKLEDMQLKPEEVFYAFYKKTSMYVIRKNDLR